MKNANNVYFPRAVIFIEFSLLIILIAGHTEAAKEMTKSSKTEIYAMNLSSAII